MTWVRCAFGNVFRKKLRITKICTFFNSGVLISQTAHPSFWDVMPGWAALIIFIVILFWLGVMEGLQVKLLTLQCSNNLAIGVVWSKS